MSTKNTVALLLFLVAAVLAAVAAFVPPAHGMLLALAVSAASLGGALTVWS